jgi:uroporphyrin-III C-methyltransferase / precorrin-2 dehydrogenase / sirohydrochlorin ferrochelatase
MTGKVILVGAGPGDPDLLTLKAAKVLRSADVVLHDELVSAEILKVVPATAEVLNVGKRCGKKSTPQEDTNRLLVQHALMGRTVVRLKGGDPFIFGRGGEELEALRNAGIEVEVVPGITAALGAAAGNQIPLTHREIASTLVLVTGSSKHSGHIENWPDRLPANATVVVYMPGHDFAALQQRLISSGVGSETPCAIISGATTESEQVHITTVTDLLNAPRLVPPRLVVVGEVVRFADQVKRQFSVFTFSNQLAEVSSDAMESVE